MEKSFKCLESTVYTSVEIEVERSRRLCYAATITGRLGCLWRSGGFSIPATAGTMESVLTHKTLHGGTES